MKNLFNNLHAHSHYSIGDATLHIDKYIEKCKKLGSNAVALTEHGNLASAYELHKECKKREIKPILGIEVYMVDKYGTEAAETPYSYYHVVLLCKNETGWKNLKKLHSASWQHGYLRRPRISQGTLQSFSDGLIVLTACLGGVVGKLLLGIDPYYKELSTKKCLKVLKKRLKFFINTFGDDFYYEMQLNDLDGQNIVNKYILGQKGKKVITNDIHYLRKMDWEIHDIVRCRAWRKTLKDENNGIYPTHQLYVKGIKSLRRAKEKWHDYISDKEFLKAMKATEEIAEKVEEYPLVPKKSTLPKYGKGDSMETLTKLCKKGYKKRLTVDQQKSIVYKKRLKRELKVIKKIGFPDYFLFVWNVVRKCKKKNIIVGPGRGSVCGSLAAYLLNITQIDPIRFNLMFERFLNEDRLSMPDIDMDFSKARRDDVKKIMEQMYGADKLAHIAAYAKWKPRGVITDVGRVLGYDYFSVLKKQTKLVDSKVEKWKELPDEIKPFLKKNKTLTDRAKRLMETVNQQGVHASGIIVTPSELEEWLPTAYTVDKNDEERRRVKVSEWDMYALEDLDLLKFDRLGLTTLDVIQRTVELVNRDGEKIKDIDEVCLNDLENKKVYELIRTQELQGLFQIETSQGMARLISDMKPKRFNDIVLIISLFRTAVLKAGMHTEYVKRRNWVKKKEEFKIKMIHPMLKDILKETYGVLIFQEQVMAIANKMGNMTLREADNFRKAIKLKDSEKFGVWKEKFLEGAKKNNVKDKIAKKVWDWMYKFSGYGFNVCLAPDNTVLKDSGEYMLLSEVKIGDRIKAYNVDSDSFYYDEVIDVIDQGKQEVYEVQLNNGSTIKCTMDHRFLCKDKLKHPLWEILKKKLDIICE